MWREKRRRTMLLVVAFAVAACTNATADTTTTTPETTTTTAAQTTTTAPPTTTTTSETTTPSSEAPTETVGSPEALAALVDEGIAFSSLAYGEDIDRSIVPDLTALTVVAATKAIFEFEAHISTLAPAARWVDVFALPGSPAYAEYNRSFTSLEESGLRAELMGGGYSISDVRLSADGEVSSLALESLGDAPNGSFVLHITSSSGPIRFVNGAGEISSSNDGWTDRTRQVIVAPSDSGWKLFWTESI